MKLTERGKVSGGKIILPQPLAIPDGTDVVVRIETLASGGMKTKGRSARPVPKAPANSVVPKSKRRFLSPAELRQYAKEHPAPAEWWNATDNPFEP